MNPSLSVVVPILGYDSLGAFMQTLSVAWGNTIEVIILDSTPFGERHDSVNYDVSGRSTIIRAIIDPPINLHAAWNLGLRMARGKYIALVNDDILFGDRSLYHCTQAIEKFNLPCVFPQNTTGPAEVSKFEELGKKIAEQELNFIGLSNYLGFFWVFAREVLDIVGPFDERFNLYYGDKDYWYRLIEAGYPPRCVQNAMVHHFESRTINILRSAKKLDFEAISKSDRALFKEKWGKKNSKALLRELKLKGGVPDWR